MFAAFSYGVGLVVDVWQVLFHHWDRLTSENGLIYNAASSQLYQIARQNSSLGYFDDVSGNEGITLACYEFSAVNWMSAHYIDIANVSCHSSNCLIVSSSFKNGL